MTDRLDALREAALRLDQAMDADLRSPSAETKAKITEAEQAYAKALDDLHQPVE